MSFLGWLTGANEIGSFENLFKGQGQNALTAGQNTAAPGLQLLTQLAKGDQGDVSEAAQPQIDSITQQFDQIRNMISQQPRGGGKTTALAEAPFQKSGAIARTEGDMRSGAAGQLAGLGLQQEGIGTQLEGLGFDAAKAKPSILNQLSDLVNFAGNTAATASGIAGLIPSGGGAGGAAAGGGNMDDPGGLF